MATGLVSERLTELGVHLPVAPAPAAAYAPAVRAGALVFTAGQLPVRAGIPIAIGRVGDAAGAVSPDVAAECARTCAVNALAAAAEVVGGVDALGSVVKVTVFVASEPGFTGQAAVANGCSVFLQEVFGTRHARTTVGVSRLPLDVPVQLDLILALREGR